MKLFLFIMSLFLIQTCQAQSQLPKQMPEKVVFSLSQNGGMSRSYKKIKIENGVLEFEELKGNQNDPQKWSVNISAGEIEKLYKVFFESKFDLIKNDARQGIVYDAGSENIVISFSRSKYFHVASGKTSPLSGNNLSRYQSVRMAIYNLIGKYQNSSILF